MNICLALKEDAFQIAKIHEAELKEGFLSSLKTDFLCKFYEAIISSKYSFCIVAKEGDMVAGFITGVTDINIFYKYFFKNYFFVLIPIFLPKFFTFSAIKRIIENIFYTQKIGDLPMAELLTFAVKKEFQRQGLGNQLLQKFITEMKNRQIRIFKALVGKNMDSLNFYKKNGFQQVKEINLHDKEISLVLVYKII